MQKRPIPRGRPTGTSAFDSDLAQAFGAAVRHLRTEHTLAQEKLAHLAGIERSHMGKIERGESLPSLPLMMRIAKALDCKASDLIQLTEARLDPVELEDG